MRPSRPPVACSLQLTTNIYETWQKYITHPLSSETEPDKKILTFSVPFSFPADYLKYCYELEQKQNLFKERSKEETEAAHDLLELSRYVYILRSTITSGRSQIYERVGLKHFDGPKICIVYIQRVKIYKQIGIYIYLYIFYNLYAYSSIEIFL